MVSLCGGLGIILVNVKQDSHFLCDGCPAFSNLGFKHAPEQCRENEIPVLGQSYKKLIVLLLIYGETDTIMVENGLLLEIDRRLIQREN